MQFFEGLPDEDKERLFTEATKEPVSEESIILSKKKSEQEFLDSGKKAGIFFEQIRHSLDLMNAPLQGLQAAKDLAADESRFLSRLKLAHSYLFDLAHEYKCLEEKTPGKREEVVMPELFEEVIAHYPLTLIYHQHPTKVIKVPVLVNPMDFKRIFHNLVQNAVQASSRTIECRTRIRGGKMQFFIIDQGKGVPKENISKLGKLGFTDGKVNGSGIGVWASNELAAKYNGLVRLSSTRTKGSLKGTTFLVDLPLEGNT